MCTLKTEKTIILSYLFSKFYFDFISKGILQKKTESSLFNHPHSEYDSFSELFSRLPFMAKSIRNI